MGHQNPDVGLPTPSVVSGPLPSAAPTRAPRQPRPRPDVSLKALHLEGEDRRRLIAEAAYYRAERRGFTPGSELEDWLAAEIEIDALLGHDDDERL
jgi:hypothetical protein